MNDASRSHAIAALDRLDHAAAELRMLFRTPVVSDCFHALGMTLLARDPVTPAVVAAALITHLRVVIDELDDPVDILAIEALLEPNHTEVGRRLFLTFCRAAKLDVVDVMPNERRTH